MASSVVKIRVFFVVDIQGFGRLGQKDEINGLPFDLFGLWPRQRVKLHSIDGKETAISYRVPVSEA